jgi:pSer/pThr/pTyr-binding forkhead associated (FHA) protein
VPIEANLLPAQDAALKPSALIQLVEPKAAAISIKVDHTPFSIGRRKGNDAVLPLDYASGVSGNHLIITFLNGSYYVQDDKSTYGTTRNSKPLQKGMQYPLHDGDILGLGPVVKIVFQISFTE